VKLCLRPGELRAQKISGGLWRGDCDQTGDEGSWGHHSRAGDYWAERENISIRIQYGNPANWRGQYKPRRTNLGQTGGRVTHSWRGGTCGTFVARRSDGRKDPAIRCHQLRRSRFTAWKAGSTCRRRSCRKFMTRLSPIPTSRSTTRMLGRVRAGRRIAVVKPSAPRLDGCSRLPQSPSNPHRTTPIVTIFARFGKKSLSGVLERLLISFRAANLRTDYLAANWQ